MDNLKLKRIAKLMLATIPDEVATKVILVLAEMVLASAKGNLKLEDIPESTDRLIVTVCAVVGKEELKRKFAAEEAEAAVKKAATH